MQEPSPVPRAGKIYFYEMWPPRNDLHCFLFFKISSGKKQWIIRIHSEEVHILLSTCIEACYGLPITNFYAAFGAPFEACEALYLKLKRFYYEAPFRRGCQTSVADHALFLAREDVMLLGQLLKTTWAHFGWDSSELPMRFDCTHEDFFDLVVTFEEWLGQIRLS